MKIRKRFFETFVHSVLTYGCKAWIIDKTKKKKLEEMVTWNWRRMIKTSWAVRKINEQVLAEVNEDISLLNWKKMSKVDWA